MAGVCPGCGNVVTAVNIEQIDVYHEGRPVFNGINYVCQNLACQTVLSASIDPLAVKADIVQEVLRGVRQQ